MTSGAAVARTSWALLAAIALAGAALVLVATSRHGPGVFGATGVDNLAAAESLLQGRGLLDTRGQDFALWPPLFPLVLAAGKLLGVDYPETVRWTSAASLFVVVLGAGALVLRASRSRWLALACALLLAASPALMNCFRLTRSEPLFLALVVGATWVLDRYLERPTRAGFAALALLSALAALQRYTGLALVAACALLILAEPRQRALAARARAACAYAALAALPLAAWMARNRLLQGELSGERWEGRATLGENLAVAWVTLQNWAVPVGWRGEVRALFPLFAALVAALLVRRFVAAGAGERRALLALGAFPLLFVAGSVWSGSRVDVDPLLTRLMIPVYPFAVAAVVLAAESAVHAAAARGRLALAAAVVAVLALAGLFAREQYTLLRRNVETWLARGAGGFHTDEWVASPLGAHLAERGLPAGRPYSNAPEFVFLRTRRHCGYLRIGLLEQMAERLRREGEPWTIVLVTQDGKPRLKLDVLRRHHRVEELERFPDGAIFALTPLSPEEEP